MENENIEQIKQKLAFMNINKIISIDNEWSQNNNIDLSKDIIDFIEELHPKNEKELLRKISNKGYLTLKNAYDDNDEELIKLINSKNDMQNQLPPHLEKLDKILEALQLKGIAVDKIDKYKPSIFQKYNTENCLFILDKEMDEVSNKDIIKESIPNIIEESDKNGVNHLIIVYSSNISDEYVNNSKKLAYVQQRITSPGKSNFYIYKMFAIEKNLDTKLDQELNSKISDCIYGDALYHYMVLEKSKTDKIYDSICEIDNEEISRISEENFIEGNNITDSINTIKKAITKMHENEQFDKEKNILEKFNFYQKDKIKNFVSHNSTLTTNSQYRKYRESQDIEFVENILQSNISIWENIDYSVNKFYKDISTGDIFKTKLLKENKEQYLLIIENACDCILRSQKNINNISRKNKTGSIKVLLLEKYDIIESEKKQIAKQFGNGEIIFPIKEHKTYYLKNTGKVFSIPEFLLDLCTLNEEGKCLTNYSKEIIQKYKNYYFEKYMDMPQTIEKIENFKKYLLIDNSHIKKGLELQEESEENIIKPFQIEKDKDGNPCMERIGRLDYNITLRVCQKNYYEIENQIFNTFESQGILNKLKGQQKTTIASIEKIFGIKK